MPSSVEAKDVDCSLPSYSDPGACTEVYCKRQKEGIKRADRVRGSEMGGGCVRVGGTGGPLHRWAAALNNPH